MTAREIADNSVIQMLSRLLMPIIFSATVWFGYQWLDGRFDAQAASTAGVAARAADVAKALEARVTSIENDRLPVRIGVLENNNTAVLNRLDRIQDSQASMAVAIGSLAATIRAQVP